MEYEMNRLGWRFAGCPGGRITFRKTGVELSFKDWEQVREYVERNAQKDEE